MCSAASDNSIRAVDPFDFRIIRLGERHFHRRVIAAALWVR